MRTTTFALLLLLIVLPGCEDQILEIGLEDYEEPEITVKQYKAPILTNYQRATHAASIEYMDLNANQFLGIAYNTDKKLDLGRLLEPRRRDRYDESYDAVFTNNLRVVVDINQTLSIAKAQYSKSLLFFDSETNPSTSYDEYQTYINSLPVKNLEAVPVFIYNLEPTYITLNIQNDELFIVQEAIDTFGNWRPIEQWNQNYFGANYSNITLDPKQVAIAKIYKYSGDFKTLLRIKLRTGDKVIYSEPFEGSINTAQFGLIDKMAKNILSHDGNNSELLDAIFLKN